MTKDRQLTKFARRALVALVLPLAGCASSGGEAADGTSGGAGAGGAGGGFVTTTEEVTTTTTPPTTESPTTEAPTTEAPTTTVPPTTTAEAPTTTEFDLDNELLFAFSMAAIRDDSPEDIFLICSRWVTLNWPEKWLFVNDSFFSL